MPHTHHHQNHQYYIKTKSTHTSPSIFQITPQIYENKAPSQKPWLEYHQYMKSIKFITCKQQNKINTQRIKTS
jgi:hypothetical protein